MTPRPSLRRALNQPLDLLDAVLPARRSQQGLRTRASSYASSLSAVRPLGRREAEAAAMGYLKRRLRDQVAPWPMPEPLAKRCPIQLPGYAAVTVCALSS
jgi:hypothetical protein